MQVERAFFDSLRNLPEQERRKKMEEHFAKNPPPQIPGLEIGPPPGAGTGGGGMGGPDGGLQSGYLPSPEVRRSMDQHIVDSQKNGGHP